MKEEVHTIFSFAGSRERIDTLNSLHVGVFIQGPNSEILFSNKAALSILGIAEDKLLGKTSFDPYWDIIHEDGSPFPESTYPVAKAIATKQNISNVIMGVHRPSMNDLVWLLVNAELLFDNRGEVKEVIFSFS